MFGYYELATVTCELTHRTKEYVLRHLKSWYFRILISKMCFLEFLLQQLKLHETTSGHIQTYTNKINWKHTFEMFQVPPMLLIFRYFWAFSWSTDRTITDVKGNVPEFYSIVTWWKLNRKHNFEMSRHPLSTSTEKIEFVQIRFKKNRTWSLSHLFCVFLLIAMLFPSRLHPRPATAGPSFASPPGFSG